MGDVRENFARRFYKGEKHMTDIVKLQPQTSEAIEAIKASRLAEGVKDSKARIIAEAVSALAKKELKADEA